MTDRTRYLTVVLDRDMRQDDAADLSRAICAFRGVSDVLVGESVNHVERSALRRELEAKLWEALND